VGLAASMAVAEAEHGRASRRWRIRTEPGNARSTAAEKKDDTKKSAAQVRSMAEARETVPGRPLQE